MTSVRKPTAGGTRRPNHAGSIRARTLSAGEQRYEARLHRKHLGTFATRAEAQQAIDAAQTGAVEQAQPRREP